MNDKAGIAANQDYGRDEDAAVKALKKHKVYLHSLLVSMTCDLASDSGGRCGGLCLSGGGSKQGDTEAGLS